MGNGLGVGLFKGTSGVEYTYAYLSANSLSLHSTSALMAPLFHFDRMHLIDTLFSYLQSATQPQSHWLCAVCLMLVASELLSESCFLGLRDSLAFLVSSKFPSTDC